MHIKPALFGKVFKPLVFCALSTPLIYLITGLGLDYLGANPIEHLIRSLGEWALIIMILTLTISPLSRFVKWPQLVQSRRMIGLFSFFYALLHLAAYLVFEQSLEITAVLLDIWERPFITDGFVAFLCLIPLAVTSTNAKIRQMGHRWKQLHRIVYLALILAVLHYWWLVKADVSNPTLYASLTAILFFERVWRWLQRRKKS